VLYSARGHGRLAFAVLAIAVAAFFPERRAAAAFEFKDEGWEGSSELLAIARAQLGKPRVRLVAVIPWDELQPSDALLVMHPESDLEYRDVAAFLAAGGRIGVVDDFGRASTLLARFRIHRVRAPFHPDQSLRDNPNLPIAIPSDSDSASHPIVAGVDRVVTNHPSGLETESGLKLTTVLEIPAAPDPPTALALIGVIGDAKRCGLVSDGSESLPPALGTEGRCGRLFAMGDPSALMNLMLRYPGNRTFATHLVDYLVGDDTWGRRGGTLYLVANEFSQSGTFGSRGGVLASIDERLEGLARLVADTRREGLPSAVALVLAVAGATLSVLWAILASTRRYRRATPRYARAVPRVAEGGLAGRAAVLSAESTHRALAVLELKSALEETLRQRLELGETAGARDITQEIDRRGALGRRNSEVLRELFAEMAKAEASVTRTERLRVTTGTVRSMHDRMKTILAELDQALDRRLEGRP